MISNYLVKAIKILLFATILTPLIFTSGTAMPFIVGKTFFFRILIELALILFLVLIFFELNKPSVRSDVPRGSTSITLTSIFGRLNLAKLKNPLFISLFTFFISLVVSSIFAATPYRAFWGNIERAEGLWGMLHFFAFLGIAIAVFNKKEWLIYFKISLAAGIVIAAVGILQYWDLVNLSFIKEAGSARPGSFVGNAAFFAGYLSILLAMAVFIIVRSYAGVTQNDAKETGGSISKTFTSIFGRSNLPTLGATNEKFWRIASIVFIFLAVIGIFISGTRGAMVGIFGGIITIGVLVAIFGKNKVIKRIVAAIFVLLIAFGSLFLVTKNGNFWQNVPGFARLAQTNFGDSVRTRTLAWRAGLEAFKEKPIFGWGLEHFITAYAKYYNPEETARGSTWLDRAHNRFIDVLVMQGVFGFLAYVAILWSVFYLLFKRYEKKIAIFTSGAFAAYIIQNFFVFDDLNTYLPLFAFLGFLISESVSAGSPTSERLATQCCEVRPPHDFSTSILGRSNLLLITRVVIVIVIVILGYSIHAYNYVPYQQSRYARLAVAKVRSDFEEMPILERAFNPYNFAQSFLRSYVIDERYKSQEFIFEESSFEKQAVFLEKSLDEIIAREPANDIRWYIRKNQINIVKARKNNVYYKDAEVAARKGLELSPKRQELYYGLVFALLGQERFEEAVATAKKALALNPEVARSHYHLMLAYIVSNKKEEAEKEIAWFETNDPYFEKLPTNADKVGMLLNYSLLGRDDKLAQFISEKVKKEWRLNVDARYYVSAFRYLITRHDAENAGAVAQFMLDNGIIAVENPNAFIDAIKNGRWELVEEEKKEQNQAPIRNPQIETISKEKLLQSLKIFIAKRDKENVLKTAQELTAQFPETTGDMEVIIDLANKEEWEILEKL